MTVELKCGSLFSGIGGGDLGLQRAGFKIAWQVELDEWCRRVLTKHWPDVPKHRDVRDVGKHNLEWVHLIHGGFPCTGISPAGQKRGLLDEQSGLWREFARVVCELRPAYVLVENSADLTKRGLGVILGDLAAFGYDAEWSVLSACAVGASHTRERMFVLAYANGYGYDRQRLSHQQRQDSVGAAWSNTSSRGQPLSEPWHPENESRIRRVLDGVSRRMDRLRGLGNAEVPQVVEWLGKRIMASAKTPSALDAERMGE